MVEDAGSAVADGGHGYFDDDFYHEEEYSQFVPQREPCWNSKFEGVDALDFSDPQPEFICCCSDRSEPDWDWRRTMDDYDDGPETSSGRRNFYRDETAEDGFSDPEMDDNFHRSRFDVEGDDDDPGRGFQHQRSGRFSPPIRKIRQPVLLQTRSGISNPNTSSRELRTSEWAPWEQEEECRTERDVEGDPNPAETVVREQPQFRGGHHRARAG